MYGARAGRLMLSDSLAVYFFEQFRLAGKLDRVAKQLAADACMRLLPGVRMSINGVGRALRHYQPKPKGKGASAAARFALIDDPQEIRRLIPFNPTRFTWPIDPRFIAHPGGKLPCFVLAMRVGARPIYPSFRKPPRPIVFGKFRRGA